APRGPSTCITASARSGKDARVRIPSSVTACTTGTRRYAEPLPERSGRGTSLTESISDPHAASPRPFGDRHPPLAGRLRVGDAHRAIAARDEHPVPIDRDHLTERDPSLIAGDVGG